MEDRDSKDIALVAKSMQGDKEAFRELVEIHKNASLSLACSILKNQVVAEDAVQTAFIKVYQKMHTFKQWSKFSTWLYRIVVNTSYNILKQQKKYVEIETGETLRIETEGEHNDTPLMQQEKRKYICLALNDLNPDEALVLRLFYLYEYKISEIQKITGFSNSKIKVNLHRGRKNMGDRLKKLLGNELKEII